MYTGIISIPSRGLSWQVEIATTYSELAQGLGGRSSLDTGNGMLFDMGSEQSQITINMQEMLFPLDIIFFDENFIVVAMAWSVDPLDDFNASFPEPESRARFFLEVNAGEISETAYGDQASLNGYSPPDSSTTGDVFSALISGMIVIMMMSMMMGMMTKTIKEVK